MQRGRRRIKADVGSDDSRRERLTQPRGIGDILNVPALLEVIERTETTGAGLRDGVND
jgi:hypothetical protein